MNNFKISSQVDADFNKAYEATVTAVCDAMDNVIYIVSFYRK